MVMWFEEPQKSMYLNHQLDGITSYQRKLLHTNNMTPYRTYSCIICGILFNRSLNHDVITIPKYL